MIYLHTWMWKSACNIVLPFLLYNFIFLSFHLFLVFFKRKKLFLLFSYFLILCNKIAGYNWYSQNRIKISILGNMITCIYFNYLYFLYRNTRCNFFFIYFNFKNYFLAFQNFCISFHLLRSRHDLTYSLVRVVCNLLDQ